MWVTSADLDPNIVQCGKILSRGAIKSNPMQCRLNVIFMNYIFLLKTKIG